MRTRFEVDITPPYRMLFAQKWGGGRRTFSHRGHATVLAQVSWGPSNRGRHRVVGEILGSRRLIREKEIAIILSIRR